MSWVSLRCGPQSKPKGQEHVGTAQIKVSLPDVFWAFAPTHIHPFSDQSCSATSSIHQVAWVLGLRFTATYMVAARNVPLANLQILVKGCILSDWTLAVRWPGGEHSQRRRDATGIFAPLCLRASGREWRMRPLLVTAAVRWRPQGRRFRGCDVWNGRPSAVYRLGVRNACFRRPRVLHVCGASTPNPPARHYAVFCWSRYSVICHAPVSAWNSVGHTSDECGLLTERQ